jgi:hypothetical protein
MKTCFKCNVEKSLDEFYSHPATADGLLGKCKQCTKNDVSKHRELNIEKVRAYDRRRGLTKERKLKNSERSKEIRLSGDVDAINRLNECNRRYAEKYPLKKKAKAAVRSALKSGKLLKMPCQVCGNEKVHAHHEDYAKPLDVVWLCVQHHEDVHHRGLKI